MAVYRAGASLRLFSSSGTAAEVTERLGLTPTRSAERGDPLGKRAQRPREQSLWLLESPLEEDAPLDEHLGALLDLLDGKEDALTELAQHHEVDLWCFADSNNGQGELWFTPRLMGRLAELPSVLGIDLYLSDDPEEDEDDDEEEDGPQQG